MMEPTKLEAIQAMIDDGASKLEIQRTLGASWQTLKRHFPDYKGMDCVEGAKLGAAARRASLAGAY